MPGRRRGQPPAARAGAGELLAQALAAVAFYVGAQILAGAALGVREGGGVAGFEQRAVAVTIGLAAMLGFGVAWPPAVPWRGAAGLGWRRLVAGTWLRYAAFLVAWVPLAMVVYPWLMRAAGQPMPPQETLTYFVGDGRTWRVAVVALMACALAPCVEEVVFRGYLQSAAAALLPRGAAVLLTAALFGCMHGLVYAFPVGLLGLLFGVLRERYGGLLAPIVAHATHNTLMISITFLWPQTYLWTYR